MSELLLNPTFREHHQRIRSALLEAFSLARVAPWITSKTFIEGAHYSFVDHEYQQRIIEDQSREINVKKCSQMGLSELAVRRTLAIMDILPDIHAIYTLPTANFAKMFSKTRIDPVIAGSKYLRERLNPAVDSFEMKQIGSSYLYLKGTIGQAAAISVPASLLVHDEVDFSDSTVLSSYTSRLTHSKHKLRFNLSTPTVPGFGIDEKFQLSRRFFNFLKCHYCNYDFLPDYFQHVKVPGYDGDLREITKDNLHLYDHANARVVCPKCGRFPDLGPENRRWVLENSHEAHTAAGYQVSPFDGPKIITPGYLVQASTQYRRYVDFVNFGLGQCAEDADNALSKTELETLWLPGETPTFSSYVCGVDAGLTMHVVIAGVTKDDMLLPVCLKRIPLTQFWDEWAKLTSKYRLSNGVVDSLPYSDLVARIQQMHHKIYGAHYTSQKTSELFQVTDREKDPEKLKTHLQVVSVNRNKAFDALMAELRSQKILFVGSGCETERDVWLAHMLDMKRMQKLDQNEELFFNWEKSTKGNDHYHHAMLYCFIAKLMRGFGEVSLPYGTVLSSFKNKSLQ